MLKSLNNQLNKICDERNGNDEHEHEDEHGEHDEDDDYLISIFFEIESNFLVTSVFYKPQTTNHKPQ